MELSTQQAHEIKEWPKVAIIILNWNGWRDTIECLESLQRLTYPNYQIIVVDNGSTDDSVERIKAWAQGNLTVESKFFKYDPSKKPVTLVEHVANLTVAEVGSEVLNFNSLTIIRTEKNLGFAEGNNIGIRYAMNFGATYIWLLNNDTVVLPETLTLLVKRLLLDQCIGIISPKICYYSDPERIWFAGGVLRLLRASGYNIGINEIDNSSYRGFVLCSFITGCAMLVKRDVFDDVGLLDASYFLYVEDVDFSLRAKKRDWKLGTDLDTVIYHKVSKSSQDVLAMQTYYIWRNRMYFSAKHHSKFQRIIFNMFWFSSRMLKLVSWLIRGRMDIIDLAIKGYQCYKKGIMGYYEIGK